MRVSISLTNYSWPEGPQRLGPRLGQLVRDADKAGIDTVWVPDHLLQADPTAAPDQVDMLEAYTTLGFLAAHTERVRLGTMVTAVTFRAPALLVKAVSTLDVLTGGRAWLGIGAGYHDAEAKAMGLSMPPVAERFERLEETVQIATRMWAGDESPFEGTHYRLASPQAYPLPVRRPPILIGGTGQRRTLRLVAQYADACNVFDIPDGGATVRHNLAVLARHCQDVGRPYEAIERPWAPGSSPASPAMTSSADARRPPSGASSTSASSLQAPGPQTVWPRSPPPSPRSATSNHPDTHRSKKKRDDDHPRCRPDGTQPGSAPDPATRRGQRRRGRRPTVGPRVVTTGRRRAAAGRRACRLRLHLLRAAIPNPHRKRPGAGREGIADQ